MEKKRTRRALMVDGSLVVTSAAIASQMSRLTLANVESKVRVGVIGRTGKGSYGHNVDGAIAKMANIEMVALADEDPTGREAARQRTNARSVYADYREMIAKERLDIVAICPRWLDQHHEMILAAAQAGCHVYMEKPFCRTLVECDSVIQALQKRNLKLGIAHLTQYSPVLEVVQSLIEADEIGEVLELRARGKEDQRGGGEDLWVLGSHLFGLMRTFARGDAISCTATVMQNGQKVSKSDVVDGAEGIGPLAGDHVQANYTFGNGLVGYFASRRRMSGTPTRFAIQVFGSKGIIEMESGYFKNAYLLRDSSWSPGRSKKNWETITSAGVGKPEPRKDTTYDDGHVAAMNDLIDSIRDDRPTKCSASDSRSIIEMISAVFESHRIGGPVDLPLITRVNPLTLLK